jgi:hypothetical protein
VRYPREVRAYALTREGRAAAEPATNVPIELETGPVERIEAMETLLVYRAVLFATLLATATDTSELLRLKNRDQIIQVL